MIVSPVADRKTFVQRIIAEIRDKMVKGSLLPGDRLPPEGTLAEQFGVGRTSLREAMKALSALGVVEVRRGDGTFIAIGDSFQLLNPLEFSLILERGEAGELLELRRIVDLGCCDLVLKRATEEDLKCLSRIAEEHRELVERSADPVLIGSKDVEFHRAFLETTRNRPLIKVGRTVWALFTSSVIHMVGDRPFALKGVAHHVGIIRAIRSGDIAKLKQIVEIHLSSWYAHIANASIGPPQNMRGKKTRAEMSSSNGVGRQRRKSSGVKQSTRGF
jgi:GntR family transcriptional regulator, transcriptional repressor for pyruvate dehydrogenase complex